MPVAKHWIVDIHLTEEIGEAAVLTHAEACLRAGDRTILCGHGETRRHPDDSGVSAIGDELASARALSDLAQQLLSSAAVDVRAAAGRPGGAVPH